MSSCGIVFCLASAAAFGAMGSSGTHAYAEGATIGTPLVSTFPVIVAIAAAALAPFFAGLPRVGPTAASILSTGEPLTAVLLPVAVHCDTGRTSDGIRPRGEYGKVQP